MLEKCWRFIVFRINEVLRYNDNSYRVLNVFEDSLVWINVEISSAFPEIILINELLSAFEDHSLSRSEDPYKDLALITPEEGSKNREKRDNNYKLIKPLLDSPEFYLPKSRAKVIDEILDSNKSTKQTLYRLARRYWQRGQTLNAFLPDYKNSGAKGKKRQAKDKKLGRPRVNKEGTGALIDEFTERLFRIAIDDYLVNEEQHSFPYAYRRFQEMYKNYFPDIEEAELPSNWQMMHFYKREYPKAKVIEEKNSAIDFKKDIRPLHGTATSQATGPGSRYEIDATIADIYLVSDSDRGNIVGRPVVYVVVDVFSRMITGLYIGFENPSYVAALQALFMAITDKSEYCKQFGFDVTEENWPSIGLPDAILADRGELLGHQIESLEQNFFVRIENTPPYRGDAKGIVERCFRTLQADFSPFAPGFVTGNRVKKRGGQDYRLDAKVTIFEFTKIILSSVLYHNQYAVLEKYDRDVDIPADLPITPLNLWNWGVQNRTGRLRSVPEDTLRVSLLPRTKGTLSDRGVCIFGVYYTCQEIVKQGWMHRSKEVKRPASLSVAYDPAIAEHIYVFPERNSNKYWICKLSPHSREYIGSSFWDVWLVKEQQKKTTAKAKLIADARKREQEALVKETINQAIRLGKLEPSLSNAERIRAINTNKKVEKSKERASKGYKPESTDAPTADIVHLVEKEPDLDFPDFIDELFSEDE